MSDVSVVISAIVGGITGSGMVGLLIKYIVKRVNKLEACKMEAAVCTEIHEGIKARLDRGERKFENTMKQLTEHNKEISRLTEAVNNLVKEIQYRKNNG